MPDPTITEVVKANTPPPGANPLLGMPMPSARTSATVSADSRREYVAGSAYAWIASYVRSLPFYVDDITRDFGDDLYERMMMDAKVAQCIEVLVSGILDQGLHIAPNVEEGGEGYEQSKEVADFCKRAIDGLGDSFESDTLRDMANGLAYGNKIAENVYDIPKRGPLAGKLIITAVKPRPRHSVAFIVDAFMNVIGILALIPGMGAPVMIQDIMGEGRVPPNLLPRKKFSIFSYRPRNRDPRGNSVLRPVYTPWWIKTQILPEYLKYLAQFGSPSLWGTLPQGAQKTQATDAYGNVLLNPDGSPQMVDPSLNLLNQLLTLQNGTAFVGPFGTEIHALSPQGEGEAFTTAIDLLDRQISQGILGQALATEEGQHQTRAATGNHQDVLDKIINYGKAALAGMIRRDILKPMLEVNYSQEVADQFLPIVTLSEAQQPDFADTANAIAELEKSGYLDPSQYMGIDQMLTLPERSEESIQQAIERKNAPPVPPNGTGAPNPADGGGTPQNANGGQGGAQNGGGQK